MRQFWLVQRLKKPYKDDGANPFSFGAGLKNGGLSKEAMDIIKDAFRFDYMGSAEFEWGAVPKALGRIWDDKTKTISEIVVETKEKKSGTIYIICGSAVVKDAEDWIKHKAYDEYDKQYLTKERVGLQDAINSVYNADDSFGSSICGWLELDTGCIFFIDKGMFDNTKKIFGL